MASPIIIKEITFHYISMELKNPFTTSFGTVKDREMIIIEMVDSEGTVGWGECVAFREPWYTEETLQTAAHIMKDFLIPKLLEVPIHHPDELQKLFSPVRKNPMAKSALEGAIWDLYTRKNNISLSKALGGTKNAIDAGISIGLQHTDEDLFRLIDHSLEQGYKRVKLKIKPGRDISLIQTVRKRYPYLPIMADANSAYCLADIERLKALDEYELMMIEQPLRFDDMYEHAILQQQISTPICLDESIQSFENAKQAIALGSCKVINLKTGRVGGLSEAVKILNLCEAENISVWCGGMLESGISRAHNIALASLPQVNLPGDISSSSNYWNHDITFPEVIVHNGIIEVPDKAGIGFVVDRTWLAHYSIHKESFTSK